MCCLQETTGQGEIIERAFLNISVTIANLGASVTRRNPPAADATTATQLVSTRNQSGSQGIEKAPVLGNDT